MATQAVEFNALYFGNSKNDYKLKIESELSGENLASGEEQKGYRLKLDTLDSNKSLLEQTVTVRPLTYKYDANKSKWEWKEGTAISGDITLGKALSDYFGDYIKYSSETKTINGIKMPAKIYARANFGSTYTNVAGHDFLNVVLVPVEYDNDSFKYVFLFDSDGNDAQDKIQIDVNETVTSESNYVSSFAKLYNANIQAVGAGTYTDQTDNPFATKVE